jgi:xylulokinase
LRTGTDPARIDAVGISGQMHGATLLDDGGHVLRPCILWNDQRSGGECDWITERVGLENLLKWVGNPALAGFTIPKLLWVRNNEPDVYRRIRHVLLPKDYLNFRLTGELATDHSDASGTLLFDVAHGRWSADLAQAIDLPLSWFPPAVGSTTIVGRVSKQAAGATGLREGTPVVAGGADNACAAVGMGVVQPGQVLASIGTSGTLVAPMDRPRVDPRGRLHTFCHAVPDTWYAMGVVLSAGGSLHWWRDVVVSEVDEDGGYGAILERAADVPAGSDGLIFLPYLTGERTPHGDPNARGAFFGLSLRHGRAHLTRSVIEGVSFALADSAILMREIGVSLETVRATGGGAKSPLWRSVLASLLGARVLTALTDAGPAFGAAILAGVGAGRWVSVAEAGEALVDITGETLPNPELEQIYAGYHRLYDALYPSLAGRFAELARLREELG